jgi:translocation and assembly module TamB
VPEIKGALAGKITSRFDLDEAGHWQLALPELKVDGKLNQYPLALQAGSAATTRWSGPSRPWRCKAAPTGCRPKARSRPRPGSWMRIWMRPSLGHLPGSGGDIKGQVRVTGNQQAPRVNADLVSGRLAYAGTVLKETVIKANALVGRSPPVRWR